jgi:hypothetical protein
MLSCRRSLAVFMHFLKVKFMVFVNEKLINEKCHYTKKSKKLRKDIAQSVYDPRVKFNVFSDNPALILAEVMTKLNYVESNEDFWQSIAILADYCDQRI